MATFNVHTSENLQYQNDLLLVTVLGGIKLEGLDRMRVTLKIELPDNPRPAIRHIPCLLYHYPMNYRSL